MDDDTGQSLKNLQSWMQHCILNPLDEHSVPVERVVRHSKRLSAQQHLNIYQFSYVARLRECMAKQFQALEYACGADLFQMFADEYLQTHPSSSYTLMDLGNRFAGFLQDTRPDRDQQEKESWPDFLIELAIFEYNLNLIFDEHEQAGLQQATMDTPDDSLQLTPVFHLFSFRYPIHAYYSAFKNGGNPDLPCELPSWCAILRSNDRLAVRGLSHGQYQFLAHLKARNSVTEATECWAKENLTAPLQMTASWTEWREAWLHAGFFVQPGL